MCNYEDNEQHIILSVMTRTCSARHRKMMAKKGHLVMRMFENRLTSILLLQAVNKLLTIARQDGKNHLQARQPGTKLERAPQLITSSSFQKFVFSVTGKDIKDLLDLWVRRGGVVHLKASFTFDRKRNSVEISIQQDHGSVRYVGPMTVRIQELDGAFNHTVQARDQYWYHLIWKFDPISGPLYSKRILFSNFILKF